jgi:hypothetical protein
MNTEVSTKLQYVLLLQQSKLEWRLEMYSVLFCFILHRYFLWIGTEHIPVCVL